MEAQAIIATALDQKEQILSENEIVASAHKEAQAIIDSVIKNLPTSVVTVPLPNTPEATMPDLQRRILELENKLKGQSQTKDDNNSLTKSQLLELELAHLQKQKTPRPTTVGDIVMALVIFFIGIPAIIWFIIVASCAMR